MWNTLIAAFVFQHPSIAAMRRELLRNLQLRHLCGFDVFKGLEAVPSECAYTRFQARLFDHEQEVEQIFHDAADLVQEVLPDFGQALAIDGKELHSQANGPPTYADDDLSQEHRDGRREQDADWGVKGGGAKDANGKAKNKHCWFGFLLHLAVDTTYELPVAFEVTEASAAEQPVALRLVDQLEQRHPTVLERCGHLSADKGYDDGKLITRLWDEHEIKPVIDIRNCWQDGESSKVVEGQSNVIYTFDGEVSCVCPKTGTERSMSYGGFDARSQHPEVPLSGAREGRRVQRDAVSGGHGGAHTAQRGPAGVHPGGALQLRLEGPLRQTQRRGASQQPLGWPVRVRRPVHPRAGQDAAALHAGTVDHAGDGARAHRSRPARTPAQLDQERLSAAHGQQPHRYRTGSGAPCPSRAPRRLPCSTTTRSRSTPYRRSPVPNEPSRTLSRASPMPPGHPSDPDPLTETPTAQILHASALLIVMFAP